MNNCLSVVTNMADLYCVFLISYENVCVQDGDVNTRMSYWQVMWRGQLIYGGIRTFRTSEWAGSALRTNVTPRNISFREAKIRPVMQENFCILLKLRFCYCVCQNSSLIIFSNRLHALFCEQLYNVCYMFWIYVYLMKLRYYVISYL